MIVHFIRPYWLSALLLIPFIITLALKHKRALNAFEKICDPHLFAALTQQEQHKQSKHYSLISVILSLIFSILALSGPSFVKMPTPTYHTIIPRIILLDMSESMQNSDLKPDRLTRAKFKLRDLLNRKQTGQFALIAYTGEPFVVSPLTEDGHTIDNLLDALTPDTIPVDGQQLNLALDEAKNLVNNSPNMKAQILVLTGSPPDSEAINKASELSDAGFRTSILPMTKKTHDNNFSAFAKAGAGQVIPFSDTPDDINTWINQTNQSHEFHENTNMAFPLWRDDGRWLIIPALIFLLPLFRRKQNMGAS